MSTLQNEGRTGKVPDLLWRYKDQPYITRQRAKFACMFSIGLAFFMLILIGFSVYIQINSLQNRVFIPTLITFSVSAVLYSVAAWLIVKGYAKVVSRLVVIYSFLMSWIVIFVDDSDVLGRLDNILIMYSAMSLLPIFMDKKHYRIFIYVGLNIILSIVFIAINEQRLGMSRMNSLSFLFDVILTILFIGYACYYVLNINKNALDRAEADIRKREEVEISLAESERKYRELVDMFPQLIFETDTEGRFTLMNKAGSDLLGYSIDEFLTGLKVFDFVDNSHMDLAQDKVSDILKGNASKGVEYIMQKRNGEKFYTKVFSGPIKSNGKVMGLRGVLIDITEQKNAEIEIKKREELFKIVIEHSPDSITLSNMQGKLVMVNNSFRRLTGISDESLGKTFAELGISVSIDSDNSLLHDIKTRGLVKNVEMTFTNVLGKTLYFIYSCIIINFRGEQMILSSSVDITERKNIEVELDQYRQKLELLVKQRTEELECANEELISTNEEYLAINEELTEANERLREQKLEIEKSMIELKETQNRLIQTEKMASIGMLASGIAHEINNPLNYIKGGAYGVNKYIDNNLNEHSEKLQPLIAAINNGVDRASQIVKGLGRYSRQTNSKDEVCDVHVIINDCLVLLSNQANEFIEVKRQFLPKSLTVKANEGRLHQAFLNVISNAIQSIHEKGTIIIETDEKNGYVYVKIIDTGCGISSAILNRIFEPFYTTKAPGEGTGLGLAITNEIINEAKGTISVKSELNKGTIVTIQLPSII